MSNLRINLFLADIPTLQDSDQSGSRHTFTIASSGHFREGFDCHSDPGSLFTIAFQIATKRSVKASDSDRVRGL